MKTLKDIVKYKWQKDNSIVQCEPYVNYVEVQKLASEWVKCLNGSSELNLHNQFDDFEDRDTDGITTGDSTYETVKNFIKYFFSLEEGDLK